MNEMEAAAVSWFGMDIDKVASAMITSSTKGLSLQVVIPISADDYLGIADRMRALRGPAAPAEPTWVDENGAPAFFPMPTLGEVMRDPVAYYGVIGCRELLERAMVLSKDVRAKIEDEEARRRNAANLGQVQRECCGVPPDPFVANLEQVRREKPVIPQPGETLAEARERQGLPPLKHFD